MLWMIRPLLRQDYLRPRVLDELSIRLTVRNEDRIERGPIKAAFIYVFSGTMHVLASRPRLFREETRVDHPGPAKRFRHTVKAAVRKPVRMIFFTEGKAHPCSLSFVALSNCSLAFEWNAFSGDHSPPPFFDMENLMAAKSDSPYFPSLFTVRE